MFVSLFSCVLYSFVVISSFSFANLLSGSTRRVSDVLTVDMPVSWLLPGSQITNGSSVNVREYFVSMTRWMDGRIDHFRVHCFLVAVAQRLISIEKLSLKSRRERYPPYIDCPPRTPHSTLELHRLSKTTDTKFLGNLGVLCKYAAVPWDIGSPSIPVLRSSYSSVV